MIVTRVCVYVCKDHTSLLCVMRSQSLRGKLDLGRLDSPEGPHRYASIPAPL